MLELFRPDWTGRLQHLPLTAATAPLDAFVVSASRNIRYLTGFEGTAGLLVHDGRSTRLLLDGRYDRAAAAAQRDGKIADVGIVRVDAGYVPALAAAIAGLKARRVGFESAVVTVAELERWRAACPAVEWVPVEGAVERLRLLKDRTEIALLRRAGKLLSEVARGLRQHLRPGAMETEVARAIDLALDRAGFAAPAFPTIVASGPNSAHPHARPTRRRLAAGDLVVLDFGGVLDGYCVDLTRMAAIGQPAAAVTRLFDAVRAAQERAIAAVRPGVAAAEIDRAARSVLDERGFGAAFVHATGHGLGLDVHEAPRIGRAEEGASEPLVTGMVFTIEPGAYVEGQAGARLEDDLLVVEGGAELLTDAPRDLLIV